MNTREFNEELKELLKAQRIKKGTPDFIRLVSDTCIGEDENKDKKRISIILKYELPKSQCYYLDCNFQLQEMSEEAADAYYYGLSAKVDAKEVAETLSQTDDIERCMRELLNRYQYCFMLDDKILKKCKGDKLAAGEIAKALLAKTILGIETHFNNKTRSFRGNYYAGVLPRLKRIEKLDSAYHEKIDSYCLWVERSTYPFMEAINELSWEEERLKLIPYVKVLRKFNEWENENEKKLFEDKKRAFTNETNDYLSKTNEYLSHSFNVQNIAVSANIKTKDNYLLYSIRAKGEVDEYSIYPSVNGQTEFYDKNVKFYNESSIEDIPTLKANSEIRQDFEKELSRESEAELALYDFERNYEYYGISILGISMPTKRRRVHFNILACHKTDKKLLDVLNVWEQSLESYENEQIAGVKVETNWLKEKVSPFIDFLFSTKEFITIMFTMAFILFACVKTMDTWITNLPEWIIGGIYFLLFLIKFLIFFKDWNNQRKNSFSVAFWRKNDKNTRVVDAIKKKMKKLKGLMEKQENPEEKDSDKDISVVDATNKNTIAIEEIKKKLGKMKELMAQQETPEEKDSDKNTRVVDAIKKKMKKQKELMEKQENPEGKNIRVVDTVKKKIKKLIVQPEKFEEKDNDKNIRAVDEFKKKKKKLMVQQEKSWENDKEKNIVMSPIALILSLLNLHSEKNS